MLIHIKLSNGEDLIANSISEDDDQISIENPVQVRIHPVHGFFAKSWMLLSEENSVSINKKDVLFLGKANEKATEYYDTFVSRLAELQSGDNYNLKDTIDDDESTLEEVFSALIESKSSVKH
jgi:hypothetical protein|tara:strand:+ start:274 stop:639 length:366 start_codon:yes stop_codon:yes gene_type:complete